MLNGKHITMGIESSCDETSVGIVSSGRELLSNVIFSQISIHTKFGGVVPEIASRHHLENINDVIDRALNEAGLEISDVDLIGVTYGPGLVGALLVGVATAKMIAYAKDIPLVGVNHMHGHIAANYIEHKELEPPFMGLIVSGGHTNIVDVKDYNTCEIIGRTRDDAAGEAFDKVARVIGLGYPGGPKMDIAAKSGDRNAINFKRVWLEKGSYDFSFSGLKTAALNYINSEKQAKRELNINDIAASFQESIVDVITRKAIDAAIEFKRDKLVLSGGVAANTRLSEVLEERAKHAGIKVYKPTPILCTDNGAMIATSAYYEAMYGNYADMNLDAIPGLEL